MTVNGSSSTGRCSNFLPSITRLNCLTPTSSVLFDGNVSTLTGLDGDMWANQLLTINTTANTVNYITFDFTNTSGVRRVEVVMFNCPEWGISVTTIFLFSATSTSGSRTYVTGISPTSNSCDSLVRVCISHNVSSTRPVLNLVFTVPSTSNWVHLAEVTFYASSSTCPPDTIITPLTTTPPTTQSTATEEVTSKLIKYTLNITTSITITLKLSWLLLLGHSTISTPCNTNKSEVCPSSSTTTILASVLTAIIIVLLTTVISVLVLIAVCKYHTKFTYEGAETAGGEGQVYKEVDGINGGVAMKSGKGVSDPTYMEVEVGGGKTFQLKENKAYVTHKVGGGNTFQLKENEAYVTYK